MLRKFLAGFFSCLLLLGYIAGVDAVLKGTAGFMGTYAGTGIFDAITLDSSNQDVKLVRAAANNLALRNSTNAQALTIYNTYTDGSNYEALNLLGVAGSRFQISTAAAGTGTSRAIQFGASDFKFGTAAGSVWFTMDGSTGLRGLTPTLGVGYGTGAGGTVTQATSKATGVSLDKVVGEITMNNAALAAATIVSFTLTCTNACGAGDLMVLNHSSGGTIGSYTLNAAVGAGSATIYVRNNTAGSLSEAVVIRYAIVKGATS